MKFLFSGEFVFLSMESPLLLFLHYKKKIFSSTEKFLSYSEMEKVTSLEHLFLIFIKKKIPCWQCKQALGNFCKLCSIFIGPNGIHRFLLNGPWFGPIGGGGGGGGGGGADLFLCQYLLPRRMSADTESHTCTPMCQLARRLSCLFKTLTKSHYFIFIALFLWKLYIKKDKNYKFELNFTII